jgi:predicted AlkP superfamily phosphohydrolase/phosphomutase
MRDKKNKVILLGIDGFDPEVVAFLMRKGKLPNFQQLAKKGTFKKLNTIMPPASPVVWTTIATGVNPAAHGIFDFVDFDRKKYLPSISILKKTGKAYSAPVFEEPFWKTLSEKNIVSNIIHWPVTFPAASFGGNMITGLGTPNVQGMLNGYTRFTDKKNIHTYCNERIIKVEAEGKYFENRLYGPFKNNGQDEAFEPFSLSIINSTKAKFTLQDNNYELKKGEWSDWISVTFKQGIGRSTSAICKIFIEEMVPHVDMFVTSMQFDPKNPAANISYPENYARLMSQDVGRYYTLGMAEDAKAVNDLNLSEEGLKMQIEQIREEREKMFWYGFDQLKKNCALVLAVVFDETDRASHMFFSKDVKWKNGQVQSVGSYMEKIYHDKDIFIAKLLRAMQKDTALMIVSDHGFKSFTKKVNLNNWLLEKGYLKLKKGFTKMNAGFLYQNVDWSKTKAYSVGYFSININLKGREGNGIVLKKDQEALSDEIIKKLSQLIDQENKSRVVDCVFKKEELYSGRHLQDAGDIIVGFNHPCRIDWDCPAGGFGFSSVEKNEKKWQADHLMSPVCVPGIFFSNFVIKSETPSVLDIAPTILDLLGSNKPKGYEGSSLI